METTTQNHEHNGVDSKRLTARSLQGVPQDAMTSKNNTALSTGGAAVLNTSDQTVIDNMRTRINELETKLQAIGILR